MKDIATSVAILRRVADLLEQEESSGRLADLDSEQRVAVSQLAEAAAEAARATREIYGALAAGSEPPYDARAVVRDETSTKLPLNRKERFYTGTVLPMLLSYDAFAHLGRFLRLCGLAVDPGETRRDGTVPCQLLTEYGFAESILPLHDDRWDSRPRRRDTPDLVLVGADWLLAVEAKLFDRPSRAELELQLAGQKTLIDEWAEVLQIPSDKVKHVALLPTPLADEVGELTVPTVTWESVASAYAIVGPPYWVGVIKVACERWPRLVSAATTFGTNAEAKLSGQQILDQYHSGLLTYGYMGRRGGIEGALLASDLSGDGWRQQVYEVRGEALPSNTNWFAIPSFVEALLQQESR